MSMNAALCQPTNEIVPATHEATAAPQWLTTAFAPISLEQLNAKADMLQRRDNKYVIRGGKLAEAMDALSQHFDILQIDGKREFGYETCYFDDDQRSSYYDHHKGRRIRCKVRMRKYVEAGLCFVEIKLKHTRGMTIKKRMQCAPESHGTLDSKALEFIRDAYREQYGREFPHELKPALEMEYQRVTLVAKHGGERMTIDFALKFMGPTGSRSVDDDLFLVETKSRNANGIADKILRSLHQHPTKSCSKYCVAMAALEEVRKYNKFLVALRRLDMRPGPDAAAPPATKLSHSTARDAASPARFGWAKVAQAAMVQRGVV